MANNNNPSVNGVPGGVPTQDGEELLQAILHGNLTSVPNPQSRLLKVFVVANKEEFEGERQRLHDVVLPELQRHCSSLGLDVQLVDPHLGNDLDATTDPFVFKLLLQEIAECHRSSLGCFSLFLLEADAGSSCPLPTSVEATEMEAIRTASLDAGLDVTLLDTWFCLNANLVPPAYELQPIRSKFRRFSLRKCTEHETTEGGSQDVHQWCQEQKKLVRLLQYGARVASQEGLIPAHTLEKYCLTAVHQQFRHALGLSKGAAQRILCFVMHSDDQTSEEDSEGSSAHQDKTGEDGEGSDFQELMEQVVLRLDKGNVRYFSVPSEPYPAQRNSSLLDRFGQEVLDSLKVAVDRMAPPPPAWGDFPAPLRAAVQEVVRESQSHLCNCRESLRSLGVSQSLDSDCGPLLQIQELMLGSGDAQRTRHAPVIVCGKQGCGKSTLLSQVLLYCPEWLGSETVRLVRHVGQSPCSMYTSELLRHLCLHISLVFGFEVAPQHYSFELGKLSIWFQDLLKMLEDSGSELVILLDNLHLLRSMTNNQAAILGWLPWNLPLNVHVVCSIAEEAEAVLGLLKSRLADNLVRIPPLNHAAAVSMLQSNLKDGKRLLTTDQWQVVKQRLAGHQLHPLHIQLLSQRARCWTSSRRLSEDSIALSCDDLVRSTLDDMEDRFGSRTVRKMASYLSCTNFGLRETEIVDLLSSSEYVGEAPPAQPALLDAASLRSPDFSLTCWLWIKNEMRVLLRESYVDGCPYLHWSHGFVTETVRNRYLSDNLVRSAVHRDLAAAFHQSFLADKEDKGSPVTENGQRGDGIWSDLLRELDELWYHLLMSADHVRLKKDALCNLDFLMASIRGTSISYIRSILELVRCKVLDWEVELLYSMTKLSVDVLSQDPQQLATEILSWLRPFTDSSSPVLASLVKQAVSWCERRPSSLLVPQNSWLTLTLPPQVTSMTCPHPVTHMVTTPDSQHVLCASPDKVINMYNLPSKNLVRSFKGHKATITCLHLTKSGRWLISGSEDTDVIVWDVTTGVVQHRLSHHIAGVLCVTSTHSESLVLSGSEIGVAIVARLDSGHVVQRMENHRALISCIAVNSGDDIFATGSADRTVNVWSLEDFSLLNSISLPSSVCRMDISGDSTFLLLSCEDNRVHVRSLTTGSDVHALSGHSGTVTALAFAKDNCRCVVGCHDGKAYVYDIHSAIRLQVLAGHSEPVVSAQPQEQDRFLVTAGGSKVVVWSFYSPRKKSHLQQQSRAVSRQQRLRTEPHKEHITCLAVSRDGILAASGSKDCTVKLWQVSTGEVSHTLEGHSSAVTCLTFAPNGLYLVSGADDNTLRLWSLPVGMLAATFKEHQCRVTWCCATPDSRRVLSTDSGGWHRLWTADATTTQISAVVRPSSQVSLHGHRIFAVTGKNENSLRFWPMNDPEAEKGVSHSDAILCYTVTYDCQTIVTGSQDMSLKVWELTSGKLTQVLVGHEGPVTCVAVAPFNPSLVVSGSQDCTLIVWDMTTGAETFAFRGHTAAIKTLRLTLDGSVAISCSEDNTLQLWQTVAGQRLAVLDLHHSMTGVAASLNAGALAVQLAGSSLLPLLRLHNNPGKALTLDLPPATPVTEEAKTPGGGPPWRGVVPKRVLLKGNLKREQSFDSFYWDLRASSPKHDMTSLMDDFKRVSSPFGSREHLHLAGTIWDGNVGRGLLRDLPPVSGGKTKLGPKHKQLKKQQSMFACFPEFTCTLTGLAAPPAPLAPANPPPAILLSPQPLKEGERKEPRIGQQLQSPVPEPLDTSTAVTPGDQPSTLASAAGQQSTVCQIM